MVRCVVLGAGRAQGRAVASQAACQRARQDPIETNLVLPVSAPETEHADLGQPCVIQGWARRC